MMGMRMRISGAMASPLGEGTLAPADQARRARHLRRTCLGVVAGIVLLVAGCGSPSHEARKGSSSGTGTVATVSRALQDLSWVSPNDGWALGSRRCTAGRCAHLEHTTDGGGRWQALPDPPAELPNGVYGCPQLRCVSGISFASPTTGYLYGPALLMSGDGGRSWHTQPGPQVEALSVSGGSAYRVAYQHTGCPGPCQPVLQAAPIGSSSWRTVLSKLATPDRSGAAQIVSSGSALLVATYGSQAGPVSAHALMYRSSNAGVSWQQRGDPCSGQGPYGTREEDLIALTAAPGGFFAGLCTPHEGTGAFVITSTDVGASWQTAGALPPVQLPALIAAASSTTLAVSTGPTGGAGRFTARLLVSTDAGRHWHLAATDSQHLTQAGAPAWLGFQSSTIGRWIADPHGIWTTRDAGAHWTRAAIR